MDNILFYTILIIFLYFLFSKILENYIDFNEKQENFDPSLVPVSSIITLAKVAQKIVNGNGILTNPKNLQIGAGNGANGDLTVTGESYFNGRLDINGNLNLGSDTNGTTVLSSSVPDNPTIFNKDDGSNIIEGNTIIDGNTTINGTTTITGLTTINNNLKVNGTISNQLVFAKELYVTENANINGSITLSNIPLTIKAISKDANSNGISINGIDVYNMGPDIGYIEVQSDSTEDSTLNIKTNNGNFNISPKGNTYISKTNSGIGTGNLIVEGDLTVNGQIIVDRSIFVKAYPTIIYENPYQPRDDVDKSRIIMSPNSAYTNRLDINFPDRLAGFKRFAINMLYNVGRSEPFKPSNISGNIILFINDFFISEVPFNATGVRGVFGDKYEVIDTMFTINPPLNKIVIGYKSTNGIGDAGLFLSRISIKPIF